MSAAEFEQYKVSPGGVFAECGAFSRGRTHPEHQSFAPATPEKKRELEVAAWDVYDYISEHPQSFDAPGRSDGMFDPGQFTLVVDSGEKRIEVKTSVNAIANSSAPAERKILRLATLIRGSSPGSSCGRHDFYGIGTSTPDNPK